MSRQSRDQDYTGKYLFDRDLLYEDTDFLTIDVGGSGFPEKTII